MGSLTDTDDRLVVAPRHARPDDGAVVWRAVLTGVVAVLLAALLALAVAVAVVPRLLGGASLTVLSGSMEPAYAPGNVVVSVPQDDYRIDDGDTQVWQGPLGQGDVADLTVGYDFPASATSGNGVDARGSFDVLLELGGDESTTKPPTDEPGQTSLPDTGVDPSWLVLFAGGALGLGVAFLGLRWRARPRSDV